jgi:hypothetical protein
MASGLWRQEQGRHFRFRCISWHVKTTKCCAASLLDAAFAASRRSFAWNIHAFFLTRL